MGAARSFGGPFAVAVARGAQRDNVNGALNILVPVSGTRISRQSSELAIALAQATRGSITALFAASTPRPRLSWRRRLPQLRAVVALSSCEPSLASLLDSPLPSHRVTIQFARTARRCTPNLLNRLETWNFTVRSETNSLAAISLFDRFSSSRSSTSRSRRLILML